MIITHVEAIPYAIPMLRPLHFASGHVDRMEHVLLRITTSDGTQGIADIPPRPFTYGETQESVIGVIEKIFSAILIGEEPINRARIHSHLNRTVGNYTAKAGVDIALWDLIGKDLNLSVHRLLGGYTSSVRVSHMVGFAEPAAMLTEAQKFREEYGVETFKVKVGRHPLSLDLAAIRHLRAGLGNEVELYVDANRGWSAAESVRALSELQDMNVTFFEEPCDALETLGRRRLVRHSEIPIVADESAPSLGDAARELTTGGASALSIKTSRTGFTESQQILALAEGLGAEVIVGNQIDTQLATTASVIFAGAQPNTTRHAAELSNFLDMKDDLIAEPLRIRNGALEVPQGPGLGIHIDEDKLNHYRTDHGDYS